MMDEQLIDEVAHHGVIYNRQKYYLNGNGGETGGAGAMKYETKDEAWQTIAMKLRSDVDTCKKRWKYLRERYVSQRKQGDPPVYEHLSRPYLEKMKFLDQHIQPRKSYRNVTNFLTSPHSANSSNYNEYNMDSKSNGSIKSMAGSHYGSHCATHHYHQQPQQQQQSDQHSAMNALSTAAAAASAIETAANGQVKLEADQVFRDFAAAVASQHMQQISQSQMHHHQAAVVAAAMADSSQNYQDHYRESASTATTTNGFGGSGSQNGNGVAGGVPSSSSSMKSPLSSPLQGGGSAALNGSGHSSTAPQQMAAHSSSNMSQHGFNDSNNDDLDSSCGNFHLKKPRVQLNTSHGPGSGASSNLNNSNNNTTTSNNVMNNSNITGNSNFGDDSGDEDSDEDNCNMLQPQAILNDQSLPVNSHFNMSGTPTSAVATTAAMSRNVNHHRSGNPPALQQSVGSNGSSMGFPSNPSDFLLQLYQQLPHQHQHQHQQQQNSAHSQHQQHFNKFPTTPNTMAVQQPQQRSSEHLLGELVTTELLKMPKDRRRSVQKRILEILFFDD